MSTSRSQLPLLIERHEAELLAAWLGELKASNQQRGELIGADELREQCRQVLTQLRKALGDGGMRDLDAPAFADLRGTLSDITRTRVQQGFTALEVATFVLSLKKPLFARLRTELKDAQALADETWTATELLDQLGLIVTSVYQKTREEVITRQQQDLLELSTPVVKLWDGILALPLIGTLDSARTQVVMESLLVKVVETGCDVAIIDITGVPTVDTLVAQHLIKTVTAARLMGADCIISGIRPQIAQTIVHLGVDLTGIITKASLADAFKVALQRTNQAVVRVGKPAAAKP